MKTLIRKLLAITFVIALTSSCTSVTDSGSVEQPDKTEVVSPDQPEDIGSTDSDYAPIYDKPE